MLYKAEKDRGQRYPQPASEDLFGGVARNYQLFEPLDFLAELVQHIPTKGEHLVRYYGGYSNKARGLRAKNATAVSDDPDTLPVSDAPAPPVIVEPLTRPGRYAAISGVRRVPGQGEPAPLDRRRWAALLKHVYQADPLLCPRCGGTMKIIAFIEAHQADLIRKILEPCIAILCYLVFLTRFFVSPASRKYLLSLFSSFILHPSSFGCGRRPRCGLWHHPPPRAPPRPRAAAPRGIKLPISESNDRPTAKW